MFKELFALAEHAPVLVLVAREGERLRVNLTRKKDEDEKSAPLALSILATPDELDSELPLALAEGLAMNSSPAKVPTVSEQVKAQAEASAAATGKSATKPKALPAPAKPAPKAKSKPAPKAKNEKPAAKAEPKARTKPPRKGKPVLVASAALAAVIGDGVAKHNDAMVKVWDYIKAHDLKGKPAPKGGSWINADDKLRPIFGGKDRIASTQLAALVKKQFVESPVAPATAVTPVIVPLIKPEITFHGNPGDEPSPVESAPPAGSTAEPLEDVSAPGTQDPPEVEPARVAPAAEAPAADPNAPEPQVQASSSAPAAPAVAGDAESLDLF